MPVYWVVAIFALAASVVSYLISLLLGQIAPEYLNLQWNAVRDGVTRPIPNGYFAPLRYSTA